MNVMDLIAKISLDSSEYDSGIDSAKSKFSGLGNVLKSGAKAIGGLTAGALKATTAAIGGAATGIVALTKSAYSAYADYEQLKGGLETMFEDLAWDVEENAKKAFATTGMSANEYMETVMGFSASLNQSLIANEGNIARAAEVSDQIVSDMADNASKMGTSMESIQNAYAGFAKGQFNMLDNLKLGYGGTKEEMERLLADAEKISGKSFDISNFADLTEAIHVIQENLGIAGNAAEEASKTLSGSFGAMQASWQNLVAGFANPEADISELVSQFIGSATNLLRNAIPVISQALSGIGQAISEIIPLVAQELPSLIQELLPPIISAATTLIQSLSAELPNILSVLVDQIPLILPSLIQATTILISSLAGQLPNIISIISNVLIEEIPKLMSQIQSNIGKFTSGLTKILKSIGDMILKLTPVILPVMIDVGIELIKSLAQGFSENASEVIGSIFEIINVIVQELTNPETLMTILDCGLQILTALVNGIAENLPLLLESAGTLITNLATFLVSAIPDLVVSIGQNGATIITEVLPQILTSIGQAGADLILNISSIIAGWIPDLISGAKTAFESLGQGILNAWDWIKKKVMEIGTNVLTTIQAALSTIFEVGKNLVQGLWNGIKDAKDWVLDKIKGFGEDVLSGIKSFFGISSPSKKTAVFGRFLAEGLAVGVEDEAPKAFSDIQDALDDGMDSLSLDPLDMTTNAAVSVRGSSKTRTESKIDQLLDLMGQIVNNREEISIPVFVGGREIDEVFVDSKSRVTVRSGGQVNV